MTAPDLWTWLAAGLSAGFCLVTGWLWWRARKALWLLNDWFRDQQSRREGR